MEKPDGEKYRVILMEDIWNLYMYNYFAAIWEKKSLCTIFDAVSIVYFMVDRII